MGRVNQGINQIFSRFQQGLAFLWFRLSNPYLTAILMGILAIVSLVGFIIPQQFSVNTSATFWIATLPFWLEPWGDLLYFLGFSEIFNTVWFWGPLALLLFHSLIAVADYVKPSWQRAHPAADISSIEWQHPLAQRAEHSIRLPSSPDELLTEFKRRFKQQGFTIDAPFEDNERIISVAQWRWNWLGIASLYGGLIFLSLVLLLGRSSFKGEQFTLFPQETQTSRLLEGELELIGIEADQWLSQVKFTAQEDTNASQDLFWRLYRPIFWNSILILPTAIDPLITIQAENPSGEGTKLIPLREDLSPSSLLYIPPEQADAPFYFLIPATSSAFQLSPTVNPNEYNVQVKRASEPVPSENFMITVGDIFEVDQALIKVSRDYHLKFIVRSDWALLLLLSIIIVGIGGSAILLFMRSPWQLWLVPDVRGLGGQLYGVIERFGSDKGLAEFLEELLADKSKETEVIKN